LQQEKKADFQPRRFDFVARSVLLVDNIPEKRLFEAHLF